VYFQNPSLKWNEGETFSLLTTIQINCGLNELSPTMASLRPMDRRRKTIEGWNINHFLYTFVASSGKELEGLPISRKVEAEVEVL
jgi:hypothetical protein